MGLFDNLFGDNKKKRNQTYGLFNFMNEQQNNNKYSDKELDSYDEFRENLKDYLIRFPITNFPDFKRYGQYLYY